MDVRVLCATNRDLKQEIKNGRFREDLYFRLNVFQIHLPPLRERRDDVPILVQHFVDKFRGDSGKRVSGVHPEAMEVLKNYDWPGNIRELRNVVHRALLLRKGPLIDAGDISFDQELNRETGIAVPELPPGMTLEQMLEKLERQIVEAALRRYNNNRERVARELGVARSTLFKRLKDWGLTKQDEQE